MDTILSLTEQIESDDTHQPLRGVSTHEKREAYEAIEPQHELAIWLQALSSFFRVRNHPLAEAEVTSVLTRDWVNEIEIARQTLLRVSQLTLRMVHFRDGKRADAGNPDHIALLDGLGLADSLQALDSDKEPNALLKLAEALSDICALSGTLLVVRPVDFYTWATVGNILGRELDRTEVTVSLERVSQKNAIAKMPSLLHKLTQSIVPADASGVDVLQVFSQLICLLEKLRYVEMSLRRDLPLKQVLPIFCLVHEDARALLDFIETRALRTEGLKEPLFDALDGMNYAITMELRKVFSHELVGITSLRQSPSIYAKVENAHGLLRDCFQQSIVGLAQLFDPELDGVRLFNTFQTKLEQSLTLRNELWTMLQLVRRAEKERDQYPISRLLERLNGFREGTQRYLMYKDWEACERFIEEVAAARGAVEVTPVLHRFSAYLETLLGQVNMRAVLADYPFEYPSLEN